MAVMTADWTGRASGYGLWSTARRIAGLHHAGQAVVAVVSGRPAEPGLLALLAQLGAPAVGRERHQLLAVAGSHQAALLALALHRLRVPVRALDGAQAGLRGGAGGPVTADPARVRSLLATGHVVVVAGGQGLDPAGDLMTFGPDGDAVTADLLAASLRTTGATVLRPERRQMNTTFAREVRLRRLIGPDGHLFVVPLDHSVTDGSPTVDSSLDRLVGQIRLGGADAVVLHKGSLRHLAPGHFVDTRLIVHLSASTVLAPDPDEKYLVGTVEEALRLGADAVSVHVNLGSRQEAAQVRDLAAIAEACERWSLPLLAMVYVRGERWRDPGDPVVAAHAVSVAADLGADLVKIAFPGTVAALAEVVRRSPVPLLVAGGDPGHDPAAILSLVRDVQAAGALGVATGRAVFQSADPAAITRKIAELLHGRFEPVEGVLA